MASTTAVRPGAVRPVRGSRTASAAPSPSRSARPKLTVLAAPQAEGSTLPFVGLCTLIVAAALAALLFLNIQMSQASYEITRLQGQSQRLTEEQQALAETDERLGTPQELERQARELGMVPVADPAYIDLDTDSVIGGSAEGAAPASADTPVEEAVLPPAQIYDQPTTYHGMGNEGV